MHNVSSIVHVPSGSGADEQMLTPGSNVIDVKHRADLSCTEVPSKVKPLSDNVCIEISSKHDVPKGLSQVKLSVEAYKAINDKMEALQHDECKHHTVRL